MLAIKNNHLLKYLKQPLPFAIVAICKEWKRENPTNPHPTLLPINKNQIVTNTTNRSLDGIRLSMLVEGKTNNGFNGFRDVVGRVLKEFDNLEYTRGVIKIKNNG